MMPSDSKKVITILTGMAIIGFTSGPVIADVETMTVKATTRTVGEPIKLKSDITYVIVDPGRGEIKNDFDPTQTTVSVQSFPNGSLIVEKSTGRPVATFNSAGSTISIITAPSFDPLSSSIDARRSELNQLINRALSDQNIDAPQARDLREQLDIVGKRQAADTSRGKVMTYAEAIYLASQLNDIGDRFVSLSHGKPLPPLMGARFTVKDNEVIMSNTNTDQ